MKDIISRKITKKCLALSMVFALLSSFFPLSAFAQNTYEAEVIARTGNGSITMSPGERREVFVELRNDGSATWFNDGAGYISLYTYSPKYRRSSFDPGTWLGPEKVKRIREAKVLPGQSGTMVFELHAPQETGVYQEVFQLASEDTAWIDGGEVIFDITVTENEEEVADSGLSAELFVQSANQIRAKAGDSVLFTAGFKNIGVSSWNTVSLMAPELSIASGGSDFTHPSWSGNKVALLDQSTAPGESMIVTFAMQAPEYNGEHIASFQLYAGEGEIDGGQLDIPVTVYDGIDFDESQEEINDEVVDEEEGPVIIKNDIEESDVRVGVLIVDEETDNQVHIASSESAIAIENEAGEVLEILAIDQVVEAYYAGGIYYYDSGNGVKTSTSLLRFVPEEENAVLHVTNFDRRLTRGAAYADNEFRNILELRYADYKDRVWLINELPIDQYMKGLNETSDGSNVEYQKAILTAARTFAYFNSAIVKKRANEGFDIVSWSSDQVYNGYGKEKRSPNIVAAVEETRGVIVMYDDQVAFTPYFSRSNGQTLDYEDVWYSGQSYPWLKSVDVPCEVGNTQWGHGVGMSATGAICMAEEGMTWDEILTYFYTGVDLVQRWE